MILPLTVPRRLDCVLAPTKQKVLAVQARFRGKLDNLDPQLRRASGFAFYNTSRYDFEKLLADAPHVAQNLRNYIGGFSPNMREVLEKFDFDNTISKLDEAHLLFQVVQRFGDPKVDLHPDAVDNAGMGTIFEELIRKFNEALNENPGEHFTPRDVVHLMVDLLLAGDRRRLRTKGVVLSVYDPCCGSGGMLAIAKEHLTAGERRGGEPCAPAVNPDADIHLFGQEVNPETFAICKSDLFMKSEHGRDAERVLFGSTLSNDRHAGAGFDYMIANPPYGKDWKRDQDAVRDEHDRGAAGRFGPGLPRIRDGQLLFPAAHAGARPESGRGRLAGRHHHERLAAVHRRRGQRRERDSPLDSPTACCVTTGLCRRCCPSSSTTAAGRGRRRSRCRTSWRWGANCWRRTNRRSDTISWTGRVWRTRTCRRTTWCRRSSIWRRRATGRVCARRCRR